MAYNGFAIDTYLDAEAVNKELDALIQKPVYTIRREKLKDYVQNYFEQKCSQSKAMIAQAKKVILYVYLLQPGLQLSLPHRHHQGRGGEALRPGRQLVL